MSIGFQSIAKIKQGIGCTVAVEMPVIRERRPQPLSTTQAARLGSRGMCVGKVTSSSASSSFHGRALRQFRRSATNDDQTHAASGGPIACTVVASWALVVSGVGPVGRVGRGLKLTQEARPAP